jgi:hypothetical protein
MADDELIRRIARNWKPRLIFLKDAGTFSEMDGS